MRVYYEDTDFGGVVYYANYLKFIERARTEMLRAQGIDQIELQREHGLLFVVRRCGVDYRAPARFDDQLEVETETIRVRRASLNLRQQVLREGALLVSAEVQVACVDDGLKPVALPAQIHALLCELLS
ncbi:MAG: tol-pal system-associated acyl-CoA thioesterase [Rhodobacteraceae bacterium]|nr:tol-pal system-associated acyl-CoA thioesterase [Paracoccaceae bacterium]